MNEACKHKAAAASINWMVGLIKNKTGSEHAATKATLQSMFIDMVEKNCAQCAMNNDCHEMDSAGKMLSSRPDPLPENRPSTISNPGALLLRRMARRARLGRQPNR
ncbi:MAG: hypothetical protein WCJ64_23100 [Rhodospirillaceae bacterium]